MESIQAPLFLTGFLLPIRESGSLIPQLLIADFIRKIAVRKWIWSIGCILQALSMASIGLVAWTAEGSRAGWTIIGLLILFSLSRGLSSVASKYVLGKTIPKTKRGRVSGISASLAGLITVGIGASVFLFSQHPPSPGAYGFMLAASGCLWIIASIFYAGIKEFPGETSGGGNAFFTAIERLEILRTDKPFRHFVITRTLLLCSALTAPYYVLLAQQHLGSPGYLLGLFILANGGASLVSAPFWGYFADLSSRRVMIMAALMTTGLGLFTFAIETFQATLFSKVWLLPISFFLLSIAHQGVRVGRKTYIVDLAEGNKRTDYVALSNSLIGVILLLLGLTGALGSVLSIGGLILIFSLMGAAGAVLAMRLPEVE